MFVFGVGGGVGGRVGGWGLFKGEEGRRSRKTKLFNEGK